MNRRQFLTAAGSALAGAASPQATLAAGDTDTSSLRTLNGGLVEIDSAAVSELRARLHGDFLVKGTPEYAGARTIWNAAIDRYPAWIIRCADAEDIVSAVRFAERHSLLLSVRGGGHNHVGFALCDGGLTIDLTRLRSVEVDSKKLTCKVGGGASFADYDTATHEAGLASTGPIISTVGVGGYTLGGGIGWLHRKLGLGCDNLAAAQVVTADGQVVTASERANPDLFWAIRGGGGNFGVVSAFEFRLTPVRDVLAGLILYPLEDLPQVAAFVRDYNSNAPDDVCVWLFMRKAPASATLPTELHGRPVVMVAVCYAGPTEAGERLLQPLRRFGRPLVDLVKARPYPAWQKALDPAWVNGFRNQWIGHYLPELTAAAAQTMLEHVSKVPSPFTDVKLANLGGAVARVGENDTAFSFRDSKYAFVIQARWKNPQEDAQQLAWAQAFFDAMKVHSNRHVYVNFIAAEGEKRVADAYNPLTFQRLREIKAKYDPGNLFRMNQNIRPA